MADPDLTFLRPGEKVGLLTELPSPYRIPVFNHLSRLLDGRLVVYFMSERAGRRWPVYRDEMEFAHRMLPGRPLQPGGVGMPIYYVNGASPYWMARDRIGPVIVGGYNHGEYLAARVYTKLRRRPLVLFSESVGEVGAVGGRRRAIKRPLVKLADAYLVPGSRAKRQIELLAGRSRPIGLAPNAVDVEFFGAPGPPRQTSGPLRVIAVGHLVARKGLDVLLEAMGRLEPGRVTLVIVGAGPDRAQLEATAARLGVAATFAGHLDRDALRERYRAADVLAFPSRDDAWGLVLNEGMVAGCVPVASSAAGAVDDLILPGVTGEVVPPGDAAALAEALLLLLDRERLPAMSRAAAVHARRFSPARCAGGYVELLARLPG